MRVCIFVGNGITLEGAVPTEQDSQPKPAKRARTSFTAEQLQVRNALSNTEVHNVDLLCQSPDTVPNILSHCADHAGTVCSGQQSGCPDATETSRHDRPKQKSHTGEQCV